MKELLNEWRKFVAETNRLGMFPSKGGFKKAQKAAMMYSPEEKEALEAGARGEDDTEYKDFGEDYYIKSMDSISYEEARDFIDDRSRAVTPAKDPGGKEYFGIQMSDGEELIAEYDPSYKDIFVYNSKDQDMGEEFAAEALQYIQEFLHFDVGHEPEEEETLAKRSRTYKDMEKK